MLQWALQWGTGPSPHPVHSSSSWHPVHSSSSWHPVQLSNTDTLSSFPQLLSAGWSANWEIYAQIMAAAAPSPPVACSVGRAACRLNYDVFFTSPLSVISCSIAHIISATKTHCQPYIRLFLELYQSRQMQSRTCSQPKYIYCIQKLECSYKEYDCSVSYYLHVKSDFSVCRS